MQTGTGNILQSQSIHTEYYFMLQPYAKMLGSAVKEVLKRRMLSQSWPKIVCDNLARSSHSACAATIHRLASKKYNMKWRIDATWRWNLTLPQAPFAKLACQVGLFSQATSIFSSYASSSLFFAAHENSSCSICLPLAIYSSTNLSCDIRIFRTWKEYL